MADSWTPGADRSVIENPVGLVGWDDLDRGKALADAIEARRVAADRGELVANEDMSRVRAYDATGAFVGYAEEDGALDALVSAHGPLCVQSPAPMQVYSRRLPVTLWVDEGEVRKDG